MDVSPRALRRETVAVLKQIDAQIEELQNDAAIRGTQPEQIRDEYGNWPMVSLLLAKSQCIHTLTLLNEQGKKR